MPRYDSTPPKERKLWGEWLNEPLFGGKGPPPEEGADELPSPSAHNEGAIIKFPLGNRYVLQDGQWQLLPPAASTPRALRGEVQNQRLGLVPRSFTRTEPFPNTLGQSRQF